MEYQDIASLKAGECFCILPEPKVRLSKLQVPLAMVGQAEDANAGFVEQPKQPDFLPQEKTDIKTTTDKANDEDDEVIGVAESQSESIATSATQEGTTNSSNNEFAEALDAPKKPKLEGGFKF